MKFLKFGVMAAACAMMMSCSNEAPDNTTSSSKAETGFAAFSVNIPSVQGTGSRAVTDEQGAPSEYAVKNGRVLIFKKAATDAEATFLCMGELTGMSWTDAATGEVTTTSTGVAKLENVEPKNDNVQYGAIVVLNYASDFVFPTSGQKLGDWSKVAQTSKMILEADGARYITMSSAPEYQSATVEPTVLRDVNKAKIFQTAAQAASDGTAASVAYVQRNVAKVSLTAANPETIADGLFKGDKVKINAWGLDITNKTSYALQVTDGLKASYADIWSGNGTLNRFFGSGKLFKRVFWAIDPNYSDATTPTTVEQVKAAFNVISDVTANPACEYALENTFDINNQLQGQTTRVLVRASYTPAGMTAGETFFRLGTLNTLWTVANLKTNIENVAHNTIGGTITVDLGSVATVAGYHALNEISIKKDGSDLSTAQRKQVAVALGLGESDAKIIATYIGGNTYYVSRVKHFDPVTETPWQVGDPTYNGDNLKYLGRYGVLRNNWYEVVVNSISDPGSPVVPEIDPNIPDDVNDFYISVSVNILSWAKRVHNVDL